eukprot:TRINITY_DN4735_c1_g1_i1.p1 TRINITY_DN4735_c1_g1~~TRINITY_DN4735_c1_g1_i1.p1  ORF type:complete len:196 (-),score=44.41 TRINITY_DN4735_c1_g1_i1:553-1140(-)
MDSLVAGVLMVLQFPLNRFKVHFSNPENVQKIVSMITLPAIEKLFKEHKMRFFLKIELGIDLLDVETGEIRENVKFHFPKAGVLKVANRQFGGCKNYKSTFGAKSRCCLNPSGKDDLCFWRCLAIGLYEKTIPTISKKNAAIQRQKAICLRDEYYKKIGREPINIVLLDQIPDISQAFSINVQINTLKKKEDSSL